MLIYQKRRVSFYFPVLIILNLYSTGIDAQELTLPDSFPTFQITENNQPDDGYLFMFLRPQSTKSPGWLTITDKYGTPVFYRYLPHQSGNFELHSNGYISYQAPIENNTMFCIMDSSFVVIDSATMYDYPIDNHDFRILDNGNYLMFALDTRTTDMSTIVEGGDPSASVSGVVIREVDPDNHTIFEWNSWDHIEISDSYADLTKSSIDLLHPNSLDEDEDGNILLISRTLDEVTKINRQTGDIMFRFGGKKDQFSYVDSSHRFSRPHDFRSMGDGHYTIFDNGTNRYPSYSRGVEYILDTTNKTAEMVWEYDANKMIFSPSGGSTRRLPSGNTILCYGGQRNQPAVTEVHPDGSKAFEVRFDDVSAGRALKFPWKTNLFEASRTSVNFGMWDGYTENATYLLKITNNANHSIELTGYSLMTDAFWIQQNFPFELSGGNDTILTIVYYPVNINSGYVLDRLTLNSDINSDNRAERIAIQVELKGTKEDQVAPVVDIPIDMAVNVAPDTVFYINFSEAVHMHGGRPLNYMNVDSVLVLKKDGKDGEDVPFNAVISTNLDKITIRPDSSLDAAQVYYISITDQLEDYSGNQAFSSPAFFSTGDSVFTSLTIIPSEDINVYPNPGNGIYKINLPPSGLFDLKVFSMDGKLILQGWNLEGYASINLREIPGNFYILKVSEKSSSNFYIRKLIKN